jgi:hypothetical protein
MGASTLSGWVGGRQEESVKRIVDRSLDLKHASMGESLQRRSLQCEEHREVQ